MRCQSYNAVTAKGAAFYDYVAYHRVCGGREFRLYSLRAFRRAEKLRQNVKKNETKVFGIKNGFRQTTNKQNE